MSEGIDAVRKRVVTGANEIIHNADGYRQAAGIVREGLEMIANGIIRVMQGRQIAGVNAEEIRDAYIDVAEVLAGTDNKAVRDTLPGLFAASQIIHSQDQLLEPVASLLKEFGRTSDIGGVPDVMKVTATQIDEFGQIIRTHGLTM